MAVTKDQIIAMCQIVSMQHRSSPALTRKTMNQCSTSLCSHFIICGMLGNIHCSTGMAASALNASVAPVALVRSTPLNVNGPFSSPLGVATYPRLTRPLPIGTIASGMLYLRGVGNTGKRPTM